MLQELYLENYAIFPRLRLSFDKGLTVITGESGAGKSLILEALNLLLGGRASGECIRGDSSRAIVEGVFQVESPGPWWEFLDGMGLSTEDGAIWLSREIGRSGRNSCRLNGRPVSLSVLQELGRHLADILGQHGYLALLNPARQLEVLDSYAGRETLTLRQQVEDLFRRREKAGHALAEYRARSQARSRRTEELRRAIQEIAAAGLVPGEEAGLQAERAVLANAEKLVELLARAENLLSGGEVGLGAYDLVSKALAEVRLAAALSGNDSLRLSCEALEETSYVLLDAAEGLRRFREKIDFAPGRLGQVEDRLVLLTRLKRVYQLETEGLIGYEERARSELDSLEGEACSEAELAMEVSRCQEEFQERARELGRLRREAARKLEQGVTGVLAHLELAQAEFRVSLADLAEAGPGGGEALDYLFAPNPGEGFKPLARIASGGEVARLMLSLRIILAANDGIPMLVFDEIDSGTSGEAAQKMARELYRLARLKQVICVSHSAQIAALADCHILVSKASDGESTSAIASSLAPELRMTEIARMLGNQNLKVAHHHASELLRLAEEEKAHAGAII